MSHSLRRVIVLAFCVMLLALAVAPAALADAPKGAREPYSVPTSGAGVAAVESIATPGTLIEAWVATTGDDATGDGSQALPFKTIQKGLDSVAAGGKVYVYPGSYNETASGRTLYNGTGPYQFGLFMATDGVTLQGVKADGTPITAYADVVTTITTNATNSFGASGVWVEATDVTIAGLGIAQNIPGDNKTIEVVGENFTLKDSLLDAAYGASVYINDWRYNAGTSTSYLTKYTVEGNWLRYGGSVDISSGAGYTGSAAGRKIINNKFTDDGANATWAVVSFNGIIPAVDWFVDPVGGATVTGNVFSGGAVSIRSRGTVNEASFDWASYWTSNTFDKAVMATTDGNPAHPRAFDYMSGTALMNNTKRIGAAIQAEIDNAQAGDTVNVAPGSYPGNVTISKPMKLEGAAGGGDFSRSILLSDTQKPGYWYPDRYRPAVFESYDFGGRMVLRHGVRVADSAANRPSAYSSTFYNSQGRKYDTDLTGAQQSFSIDLYVGADWGGADQRNAGIWSTGFDGVDVSAYPILSFRNVSPDVPGFYAFNYVAGGYILLRPATAEDYGKWHTVSFTLKSGTGVEYFVDGQSTLVFADPDTKKLGNLILNVYNFGADYDVYWDNFRVASDGAAAFEPAISGQITVNASNVDVNGFYLTNPGQNYGVLIDGSPKPSNVRIAANRIQNIGGSGVSGPVKAIYAVGGPDNVTIEDNSIAQIVSGDNSADAINFGDSNSPDASTGVVIQNNVVSNITAAKGAYGVKLNNGAGSPAAQVKGNAFASLSGKWTHAVGLEGPTANAVVAGNQCAALSAIGADKSCVFFEKNSGGATVQVSNNQFNGGGYYGVAIHPDDLPGGVNGLNYTVNAENNWWNSACGPMGANAALAGQNVDYNPWLTTPTGPGTRAGGPNGELLIPAGATQADAQAILSCAGPGSTVVFQGPSYPGGYTINNNGVTINLNGATIGHGSPAFTINADDVTIMGPGTLDGTGGSPATPGITVQTGADNFTLNGVEIKNWTDGVLVEGSHASLKLVNNWLHDNATGFHFDSAAALSGVVTLEGNLFKFNSGNGIQNDSAGNINALYNAWGNIGGPAAGDGISANVTATPFTFAEIFTQAETPMSVVEGQTFTVEVRADAAGLYAAQYKLTYDPTLLVFQGIANGAFGACTTNTATPGVITSYCSQMSPAADVNGLNKIVNTITFKVVPDTSHVTGSPWTAKLDLVYNDGLYSAARDGIKAWVNNAGFGDPSVPGRNIVDDNDGEIVVDGLAGFTGYIDLQGRTNDSGALLNVYATGTSSAVLASATSASSGAYTTGPQLVMNSMYYFQVDRDLYLPTTATTAASWADFKKLENRPLHALNTVVLLGGDATNNNIIDNPDATCIGGAYGAAPTACGDGPVLGTSDVTGDGKVDILDLTLMGGNYGKSSSPWTE